MLGKVIQILSIKNNLKARRSEFFFWQYFDEDMSGICCFLICGVILTLMDVFSLFNRDLKEEY